MVTEFGSCPDNQACYKEINRSGSQPRSAALLWAPPVVPADVCLGRAGGGGVMVREFGSCPDIQPAIRKSIDKEGNTLRLSFLFLLLSL